MPLLLPAAGWASGLAMARCDAVGFAVMAAAAAVLLLLSWVRAWRVLAMAVVAGMCWGTLWLFVDGWRAAADAGWQKGTVTVTAAVESVEHQATRQRLRLADVVRQDGVGLPGKVDLYLYGDKRLQALRPGQRIRVTARFHTPSNQRNPGAFDYRAYCFDRHIALIGNGRSQPVLTDAQVPWIEQLRQPVRDRLQRLPPESRGVLLALLLADRSQIGAAVNEAFSATGAAHLLAISGLHIGLVAGWMFAMVWWLLTRRETWIVRLPVRTLALLGGVAAALLYASVAGWPLPTQRAAMMLAAGTLAWFARRRAEPLNTLAAAMILILLIDPAAALSVSLWLSFMAVAGILLWPQNSGRRGWQAWLQGMLWVSLIASLATLPVIAQVFGRMPLYSLPANLLMVPLYGLWVLPLALLAALVAVLGMVPLADWLFGLSSEGVLLGNGIVLAMQQWPGGNLWLPEVPVWATLFYLAGLALAGLLWRRGGRAALPAIVLTLAIYCIIVIPERLSDRPLFAVWDVGQGAASALILPDGRVMAIDAPGHLDSRYDGGTTAAAALRRVGVAHVDAVVITHAQSDHAGGIIHMLGQLRSAGMLWLADVPANRDDRRMQQIVHRFGQKGGRVRWLGRGDRLSMGEVAIEVLWPPRGYAPANSNDTSLVLSVELAGHRILLPGDIEAATERNILRYGLSPHDIVLIPHHGSRTSSGGRFVATLAPKHAIAQAGRFNRYRFPAGLVVARYRRQGADVHVSGNGAVLMELEQGVLRVGQVAESFSDKRGLALKWWGGAL